MGKIFGREPVLALAVVQEAVVLATAFGFDLSAKQGAAILAFSTAALAFAARRKVTPAA